MRNFKIVNIFLILIVLLLNTVCSYFANNLSFLISSFIYIFLIIIFSFYIPPKQKIKFENITLLFFSIYSLYTIVSFLTLFNNPTFYYLSDSDEASLYSTIINLSKYSYNKIWNLSFTEFKYSGLPLFFAYTGSLQKLTGLGIYYGALFQKINVAFFSSFIPGIVYLMITKIKKQNYAIKWAVIYGFLSFTFFYSGLLLRDIHIALIYTIGLYLTIDNDGNILKKVILITLLGSVAYFIRMESGVFFLVTFTFILLSNYNKQSKYKWIFYLLIIPAAGAILLVIGGFDTIYNMTISTVQGYSDRAIANAGQESLGIILRKLPIPLNYVSMTAFGQITPFPPWSVFENETMKNLFILPRIVGAVFWFFVWFHIISNFKRLIPFLKKYKYHVIVVLTYLILVSISQPYERRLMAVYPFIFICFVSISNIKIRRSIIYSSFFYLTLIIIYLLLKI